MISDVCITAIQELMSEESIHLSSQGVSRTPDPPLAGGPKAKPRFAEFACSHAEVIDSNQFFWGAKVVWRRYIVLLLWSPRLSFQSPSGEVTRTSDEL